MRLNVPLVLQRKNECSIASGMMILKYLDYRIEYDEFKNLVKRRSKGVSIFDLAVAFKELNLNPHILFFNFLFFNDSFSCKNSLNSSNEMLDSIKRACENKVNIKHKIFFVDDLINLLDKGFPIITLVSLREFREKSYDPWRGHFVVIYGYDKLKKRFWVKDPLPRLEKNELLVPYGKMFASIYRTNFPAILWIEKK